MTDEPCAGSVVCERDVTVPAFYVLTAAPARHELGKSAAVQKDYHLFTFSMPLFDRRDEFRRERNVLAFAFENVTHIDQFGFGERPAADAVFEPKIFVFSDERVIKTFERRRCRTEHDNGVRIMRADDRGVACVVIGRFMLAVRTVVFFVNDQQPDIAERRKDRRTRADDNACVATPDTPPFIKAFARRKIRVKYRDIASEN